MTAMTRNSQLLVLPLVISITTLGITCSAESTRADDGPLAPVTMRLDSSYHLATDGTQLGLILGTVHFDFHHNYYLGDPYYEITTGAGWVSGVHAAHVLAARIGTGGLGYLEEFLFGTCGGACSKQLMGISTGVTLDGAGDRIPEAWTIPVDGYMYLRATDRLSLGPIAGLSWTFAGGDRALGWRAGLDLIAAAVGSGSSLHDPRNFHVSIEAQRLDGATFLGITFGIEDSNRYYHFFESVEH